MSDRVELLARLGEGSFGQVWRGHDNKTGKIVAVKVESAAVPVSGLKHEAAVYAWLRDSLNAEQLVWFPHIVAFFECPEGGKVHMLAMELLDHSLQSMPWATWSVDWVARQLLQALEALHRAGIVHRDLKPANVLVRQESGGSRLVLADLGLARKFWVKRNEHIPCRTLSALVGSANYASVNAHARLELARRDDLESAAYVLWFWLEGGALPWAACGDEAALVACKSETWPERHAGLTRMLRHVRQMTFAEAPAYRWIMRFFAEG